MCVIIVAKTVLPNDHMLFEAEAANPHGAGVAWLEDGLVKWHKGLKARDITKMIHDGELKAPAIIHFRLATVGNRNAALCHPFSMTEQSPIEIYGESKNAELLFHNGHWHDWERWAPKLNFEGDQNDISDSRVMAAVCAVCDSTAEFIDQVCGKSGYGNRVVTINKSGIKTYGNWVRYGEFSLSNTYFMRS